MALHWLTSNEFIAVKKIFAMKIHRNEEEKFIALSILAWFLLFFGFFHNFRSKKILILKRKNLFLWFSLKFQFLANFPLEKSLFFIANSSHSLQWFQNFHRFIAVKKKCNELASIMTMPLEVDNELGGWQCLWRSTMHSEDDDSFGGRQWIGRVMMMTFAGTNGLRWHQRTSRHQQPSPVPTTFPGANGLCWRQWPCQRQWPSLVPTTFPCANDLCRRQWPLPASMTFAGANGQWPLEVDNAFREWRYLWRSTMPTEDGDAFGGWRCLWRSTRTWEGDDDFRGWQYLWRLTMLS